MADNLALDALKHYLNGDIGLDAFEDRIIPLAWDDNFDDQELIGELFIEIAYINDGVSDEDIFRERVSQLAAARVARSSHSRDYRCNALAPQRALPPAEGDYLHKPFAEYGS